MYIIAGRGGILTSLIGLFVLLAVAAGYMVWYALKAAAFILELAVTAICALYDHHQEKKREVPQAQPMPRMSKVSGPRDWNAPL
jgi:nitrate/nitrite transporter NarK